MSEVKQAEVKRTEIDQDGVALANRRMAWILAGIMAFSFAFGIAMFLPAEHRAEKLENTMAKYQARRREP